MTIYVGIRACAFGCNNVLLGHNVDFVHVQYKCNIVSTYVLYVLHHLMFMLPLKPSGVI